MIKLSKSSVHFLIFLIVLVCNNSEARIFKLQMPLDAQFSVEKGTLYFKRFLNATTEIKEGCELVAVPLVVMFDFDDPSEPVKIFDVEGAILEMVKKNPLLLKQVENGYDLKSIFRGWVSKNGENYDGTGAYSESLKKGLTYLLKGGTELGLGAAIIFYSTVKKGTILFFESVDLAAEYIVKFCQENKSN